MKTTHIGNISHGIDGHDAYFKLKLGVEDEREHNTAFDDMERLAKEKFDEGQLYGCVGPGALFCDLTKIIPIPGYDDEFIGIAFVRRDC